MALPADSLEAPSCRYCVNAKTIRAEVDEVDLLIDVGSLSPSSRNHFQGTRYNRELLILDGSKLAPFTRGAAGKPSGVEDFGRKSWESTNTYLLGNGPRRILIDTGEGLPAWSKLLSSTLSTERLTISDALLTHWHPDHVGGVSDLLRLSPDAKVYKHSATEGQRDIEDGQRFKTDGVTLKAFHCPGHTTDHMAFVLEEEDAMFTGDNVLGHGTAVFEDLQTYMSSLERMREQFSGRAYPGHGEVIDDGKKRITEYIEHRQQREQEVLRFLVEARKKDDKAGDPRLGAETPMKMVKVIYRDVPENLHEPAARGVAQILEKLAKEGKVTRCADGQRWQIAEDSKLGYMMKTSS
ncbi:MAG: hypothetical protein Q9170_005558 [Blastenia crenularia]